MSIRPSRWRRRSRSPACRSPSRTSSPPPGTHHGRHALPRRVFVPRRTPPRSLGSARRAPSWSARRTARSGAMFPYTSNSLFGETRNPVGRVTVGGSSGGEAASVASRCSALGLGGDFGGSLRWPAHAPEWSRSGRPPGRVPHRPASLDDAQRAPPHDPGQHPGPCSDHRADRSNRRGRRGCAARDRRPRWHRPARPIRRAPLVARGARSNRCRLGRSR